MAEPNSLSHGSWKPWTLSCVFKCFSHLWTSCFFCHLCCKVSGVPNYPFLDTLGFLLESEWEQTFHLFGWGKNRRNKTSSWCRWLFLSFLSFFFFFQILARDIGEYQIQSRHLFSACSSQLPWQMTRRWRCVNTQTFDYIRTESNAFHIQC